MPCSLGENASLKFKKRRNVTCSFDVVKLTGQTAPALHLLTPALTRRASLPRLTLTCSTFSTSHVALTFRLTQLFSLSFRSFLQLRRGLYARMRQNYDVSFQLVFPW